MLQSEGPSQTTPSYHPLKHVLRGTNWPHPVCSWMCMLSILSHQSSPLECIGNRLGLSEVQVQSSFKGTSKHFYRQYELLNLLFILKISFYKARVKIQNSIAVGKSYQIAITHVCMPELHSTEHKRFFWGTELPGKNFLLSSFHPHRWRTSL